MLDASDLRIWILLFQQLIVITWIPACVLDTASLEDILSEQWETDIVTVGMNQDTELKTVFVQLNAGETQCFHVVDPSSMITWVELDFV